MSVFKDCLKETKLLLPASHVASEQFFTCFITLMIVMSCRAGIYGANSSFLAMNSSELCTRDANFSG